jgi:LPS-assembly protein
MTFSVNYSSIYQDYGTTTLTRNQTVMVQLQLRTLGEAKINESVLHTNTLDGLNNSNNIITKY